LAGDDLGVKRAGRVDDVLSAAADNDFAAVEQALVLEPEKIDLPARIDLVGLGVHRAAVERDAAEEAVEMVPKAVMPCTVCTVLLASGTFSFPSDPL
jgi:hypothetical protein